MRMKAMMAAATIAALMAVGGAVTPPVAQAQPAAQAQDVAIVRDVIYGHKDGMALVYDVFKPARPNGAAVIYMVSGGWVSRWQPPESRVANFRGLLDKGFTVIAVHHGSSPRFKVPDAVSDVRRAVRHIRANAATYGIDASRMGVYGGSAGGHLSLTLGTTGDDGDPNARDPIDRVSSKVKAVVAYYPPTDLRRMTGPNDRFPALDFENSLAAAISPILHIDANDPPTLIVHGTADTLVRISSGRSMHEALTAAGVKNRFIAIEGGDHGFTNPDHRRHAQEALIAWFEENL